MKNEREMILKELIEIKAIQVKPATPFTYASGIHSPIYTDLRQTISFVNLRTQIANGLADLIKKEYPTATIIAGVATAGIPHAAFVANLLNLPMIYIRSKPKDHGAGNQIEGRVSKDDQVVLIDDLISTGGSVLKTVDAVRDSGAQVLGVTSIFNYELKDSEIDFADRKVQLSQLLKYTELLNYLVKKEILNSNSIGILKNWHQDPWNFK